MNGVVDNCVLSVCFGFLCKEQLDICMQRKAVCIGATFTQGMGTLDNESLGMHLCTAYPPKVAALIGTMGSVLAMS